MDRKIKVLIVDDSAIVRRILSDAISAEPDMEVAGTAPDAYTAREKILKLEPDVLTLDIEMPRMDGLTFLKKIMQHRPMPVIMISSLGQASCAASIEALQSGAVEVLAKPGGPYSVGELRRTLGDKIRAAANSRVRKVRPPAAGLPAPPMRLQQQSAQHPETVIAIGASTGGTQAIQDILVRLPEGGPGMVITQHIPPAFSRAFAERLNKACAMEVREARDGDTVRQGVALVAPGNHHMQVRRLASGFAVALSDGPQVHYQRPSVDVLFQSVAEVCGARATGILLTGMGKDGAAGLLQMKQKGAMTIAQDAASCVVFGMPGEAVRLGAAERVLDLREIAGAIC